MEKRDIKVTLSDFNINNLLTTLKQYYKGGRYDFLLNSDKNIDLLSKHFIVFEIDQVKDNKDLFPVVTIIIMEAFINKMRRLKGIRKMILIEEAWKAIASANMADYIKYLYKTVRKYFGEAIVVTQEVDDIIQSPIVKGTNGMLQEQTFDMKKYREQKDRLEYEEMACNPETTYLVSDEAFDKQIDELGLSPTDLAMMTGMYLERGSYNLEKKVHDFFRSINSMV